MYVCMCYLNKNVCTCAVLCGLHTCKDIFILVSIDCLPDKPIESVTTIYALFGVMKHNSLVLCISCYLINSYVYHLSMLCIYACICTDVNQNHIVRSAVAICASLIYLFISVLIVIFQM